MKKNDKRRRSYKKVYKNNKLYIRLIRNTIYFLVGILYLVKETAIETFKDIVRIVVAIIWLLIRFLKVINKFNISMFDKLRKPLKVAFIYALMVALFMAVCEINILRNEVYAEPIEEPKEQVVEFKIDVENQPQELIEYVEEKVEEKNKICENEIACKIYEKALSNGLTTEQAYIVVAISRHETGNWTSKAFNNKHNMGGVMCSTGLKQYDSLEDGINGFVDLLTNRYFNRGLDTIEKIGNIYCPIGADNDPNGLNQYWIPNVTKYYNEYAN